MNKKKFYSYGLFTNTKKNKTLCYYPVPKNANTSAKLFFAKHLKIEDRFIFLGDDQPRHKQDRSIYLRENKIPLSNWLFSNFIITSSTVCSKKNLSLWYRTLFL